MQLDKIPVAFEYFLVMELIKIVGEKILPF
jgi:hypothetical protein